MDPQRRDEAAAAGDVDDGQAREPADETDAGRAEEEAGDHAPLLPPNTTVDEHRKHVSGNWRELLDDVALAAMQRPVQRMLLRALADRRAEDHPFPSEQRVGFEDETRAVVADERGQVH